MLISTFIFPLKIKVFCMVKGQTFGEIFPPGICFLCLKRTLDPRAIVHQECANCYVAEKQKRLAERKKPIKKEEKDNAV